MNNPSQVFSTYQAFSIANMVLFGFAMAGVLVIVWIGWLRTRHIGYLVLAAWALTTMAGMAISYLPIAAALAGQPGGYEVAQKFMLWLHLLRVIVTSLLLLAGMGLLVFRDGRSAPRPGA